MALILIPISLILLLLYFKAKGWRESVIYATITWSMASLIITEILSYFSLLDFRHSIISWICFCSLVFILLTYKFFLHGNKGVIGNQFPNMFNATGYMEKISLLITILVVCIIFVIAIYAPPNDWESMTYHLPRIEHWIQNKNISFYPTHIEWQLYMSPFSEIAILQTRLLSGSDLFANLIQWTAMVVTTICLTLIAKKLNLDKGGQIITALIAITLPSGILMAATTQNDYVVSFFTISCIYFLLNGVKHYTLFDIFYIACSFGLAILTKPTGYLYLFPYLLWFTWYQITNKKLNTQGIFILIIIPLLINGTHYARTYSLYHNIFGPESMLYRTGSFIPQILLSNAIKNISLHLVTPFRNINSMLYDVVIFIHHALHVDINNIHTTWQNIQFFILDE